MFIAGNFLLTSSDTYAAKNESPKLLHNVEYGSSSSSSSSSCFQGDAEARCDSRMHDLQYCLSAARRLAYTISQPWRLQSSVTLSSQRFLWRPLALFPSTLPYRAMYVRRHLSILDTWPKYPSLLVWTFSTISTSCLSVALMSEYGYASRKRKRHIAPPVSQCANGTERNVLLLSINDVNKQ